MIRIVIENIILFLLPSVAYFAYMFLRNSGNRASSTQTAQIIDDAPILWLLLAGALVMFAVTVTFANFEGGTPGQTYVPPMMKDGHIVPGHFK